MKVPKTTIGIRDLGLEIESLGDVYKVLDFIRNIKVLYFFVGCKDLKIDLSNAHDVVSDPAQVQMFKRLIFHGRRLYLVVQAFGFGALFLPVFSDKKVLCNLTITKLTGKCEFLHLKFHINTMPDRSMNVSEFICSPSFLPFNIPLINSPLITVVTSILDQSFILLTDHRY